MSQPKRSSRVLLVSRQPAQIERIRTYLARGGYQTISSSYAEIEHQFAAAMPEAAIIEASSDYGESLSACYSLRLTAGPTLPIMMLTAQEREAQPEHDIWHCVDDYLLQPLDAETLLIRLSVLFKRKQTQATKPEGEVESPTLVAEVDEFLRLTEVARTDWALGRSGAVALLGVKQLGAAHSALDNADPARAAMQLKLALARLSCFLAPRLRPLPGGSGAIAPYGSFSLFLYQPDCQARELAVQLKALHDEYYALGHSELVAGVAAFPEDAPNILELISEADEALGRARSQGRVVCYEPALPAEPAAHQCQLLIVDDSQEQVEMLDLLVTQEGYRTLRAYNGEQALDVLSRQNPDLLLLDLAMPRLNGFDVMHRLRDRNGGRLEPPVIMVTANDCEESVMRGFELGARDYIIKPYHPRELLSRIQSILTVPTTTRGQ